MPFAIGNQLAGMTNAHFIYKLNKGFLGAAFKITAKSLFVHVNQRSYIVQLHIGSKVFEHIFKYLIHPVVIF
ncbi:hypothetical protein D3C73_1583140 [compost metagenome]